MVRKGRCDISIIIEESKISTTKNKIIAALKDLQFKGDIESATGKLTYEEHPEEITI